MNTEGIFFLLTARHTRDDYLTVLREAGFRVETVQEALVKDAAADTVPAHLLIRDGDKPFCLVILASNQRMSNKLSRLHTGEGVITFSSKDYHAIMAW